MAATIRDIKAKTGLSLATISKYLNGGNVLPENREKIQSAIEELHYEVNEIARGLVTNKTHTIGVVVYNIESPFNGTMLRYIGDVLRQEGYGLLICDSCNDEKNEADNIRFLVNKKVDGIIIVSVAGTVDCLKPAQLHNVPVVLLDRPIEGAQCDCVLVNNRESAKDAVERLITKNHEKIGVIYSEREYTGIERYKGYIDAMKTAGYQTEEHYCKGGTHSVEHGYKSMKELLQLKDMPAAIFTTNFDITLGVIMALRESENYSWNDFDIMGFDRLLYAPVMDSQISKVVQPMQELAEQAARLLLKRIGEKEEWEPVEVTLEATIEEVS